MADAVVGFPASETFNLGYAGITFTRSSSRIDHASVIWSPTFTDLLNGDYEYAYTPTQIGMYSWNGTASDGRSVSINFRVITAQQADPAAAMRAGLVGIVTQVSPDGGTIRLIQGDSYAAAQSRSLTWNLTGQPDLTAATVTLTIVAGETVTKTATMTNPAGGSPTITATLTKEETATLSTLKVGVFDVSATIGSDELTLVRGRVYVEGDVG